MLFCNATISDYDVICSILRQYEEVSGQQVNLDKTTIYFSPNTSLATKNSIMATLQVSQDSKIDKYLGVPLVFGNSKKYHLRSIKDRIEKHIMSYRECQPSQAGRGILIQSILQSIPLYYMSCYLLPKSFIHELNMLFGPFSSSIM